ncbi:hypothetical protein Hanom_Chr02g00176111 [Helianthus anomalus]
MSTNLRSFVDRTGTGRLSVNTPEFSVVGCCFCALATDRCVKLKVELMLEKILDFRATAGTPAHSVLRMVQLGRWVNSNRRCSTVLGHFPLMMSWAPVTIYTPPVGSWFSQFGSCLTTDEHTFENRFHLTGSRIWERVSYSSEPRHCDCLRVVDDFESACVMVSGRLERCCTCIANRLLFLPSKNKRRPITGFSSHVT